MNRRLAAILFYDVVGFSRAMGRAEDSTFEAVKANRREVIEPQAENHGGRTIQVLGDGGFMEFASAVDAVRFAIAVQSAVAERNTGLPEKQRLIYRIGINIGDVGVDGDFIYGDGVNIAARLEALAQPGGICIHRSVRDQVRGKLDLDFEDLGEVEVKNIERPVHAFHITLNYKVAVVAARPVAEHPPPRQSSRIWKFAAGFAAAVVLIAGVVWWQPWSPRVERASVERMAFALPDIPSVAVLPFTNMSDDKSQEYFADGLTDDLITDLSKVSGLFVIARNSTFVYKGKPVKISKVAEDLGVRYVIEGSVRRAGDQVRVNAQLIDATTGGHIWAERYDGPAGDIFEVQDYFIGQIVAALALELTAGEKVEIAAGKTDKIEAREAFQKGWDLFSQYSRIQIVESIPYFEKAIELDPDYGRAYAALALVYTRIVRLEWGRELGLTGHQVRSKASHNLRLAEQHPSSLTHIAKSLRYLINYKYGQAFEEANKAVSADPNDPEAYLAMGWAMTMSGKPIDALGFIERAMRLNPSSPPDYAFALGMAYFADNNVEKAADALAEGLDRNPGAIELAAPLAAMYGLLGERRKARSMLLLWRPAADEHKIGIFPSSYRFRYVWSSELVQYDEKLRDGLYIAATPLDITVSDLINTLDDENMFLRLDAVKTLGHFGPLAEQAVPALAELLATDIEVLQSEVIVTLGKIGPKAQSAVPALEKLLNRGAIIKAKVQTALNRISAE